MAAEALSGKVRLMTGALVLITLGVLFLLNNLYPGDFAFRRLWPVIVIVIGLAKILENVMGRKERP